MWWNTIMKPGNVYIYAFYTVLAYINWPIGKENICHGHAQKINLIMYGTDMKYYHIFHKYFHDITWGWTP